MEYKQALEIAERALEELRPHCIRAEITGSIRRKKLEVKDIEIVAIPKPYEIGLLESGIATAVNKWECVKGKLGKSCKYTQRILPEGIKLDLFFATEKNWGLIYTIRTGSAEFSHKKLACGWVRNGYKSIGGNLTDADGKIVDVQEEEDLFRIVGLNWIDPEFRQV